MVTLLKFSKPIRRRIHTLRLALSALPPEPKTLDTTDKGQQTQPGLDKITVLSRGEFCEIVDGQELLEKSITDYFDYLMAGETVTLTLGLDVRGRSRKVVSVYNQTKTIDSESTPAPNIKSSTFKLPKRSSEAIVVGSRLKGFKSVTDAIKNLRIKAISQREQEINKYPKQ